LLPVYKLLRVAFLVVFLINVLLIILIKVMLAKVQLLNSVQSTYALVYEILVISVVSGASEFIALIDTAIEIVIEVVPINAIVVSKTT